MASTVSNPPRIAIAGGGPSGLTLLLTLSRRGIPATLYEREASITARWHLGGVLDLGWDSGQLALRENGLQEDFDALSRPEGQDTKILDRTGKVLAAMPADPNRTRESSRPEIDRSKLRKLLLDNVPAESVKWGHALTSARALGDGTHELTFANGTTAVCDFLVGADGHHSRVRPLVTPATPMYQGVNGAEVSLSPEVAASPELRDVAEAVGNGTAWAAQDGRLFFAQRNGDGRIRAYLWFRESPDWTIPKDPAEARRVLLDKFEGWAPWMRDTIAHCDEKAIYPRPLYYLPPGLSWKHVSGVTLIGDAAYLMSPTGAGANLAMLAGYELGVVLAEAVRAGRTAEEREAAVAAWEEKTFKKFEKWTREALEGVNTAFAPEAPYNILEQMGDSMYNPEARKDS